MRVIVDPGTMDCLNLGDLAMLQVALARVRAAWPGAEIGVFTRDPAALAASCPGVAPLDDDTRRSWFATRFFLGGLHDRIPRIASARLQAAQRAARHRWPVLVESAMRARLVIRGAGRERLRAFLRVMNGADLYVVAGQHALADEFRPRAAVLLDTIDMATRAGTPVMLLGQAIGPLGDPVLLARARAMLPRARLVALREPGASLATARALGLDDGRVVVTGDDALAPAFAARGAARRTALGVSVRVTPVAGVAPEVIERIRPALRAVARELGAPLVPLPSAHHGVARDAHTMRELLSGLDGASDGGSALDTPERLIGAVGQCRVVVAGAYHVAVFALAQGIPVVGLAQSEYYRQKFAGLEALFEGGCETLLAGDPGLGAHLPALIRRAWERADAVRPGLLAAAERQVRTAERAFARAAAGVHDGPSVMGER
ncbi:MAG TPA: polysaccharide pyruvyl transferase family protein [Gemmatimonadaceae bacterium]